MKSIKNINFKGKKVIVRVEFNVPLDENRNITDDTRIVKSLPTLNKLISDGASVIILSHLGRPKKGCFEPEFSLLPVAKRLSELLGQEVLFNQELYSEKTVQACSELNPGQVLLMENIRFYAQETKGDIEFAEKLSKLGDAYVNDAFGTAHREHVSTAILASLFPKDKYFGLLMESELKSLERLKNNPAKPFTAIIGGAKISTKIGAIKSLTNIADNIIIGGAMAYTFHKAMGYSIGDSMCEDDKLDVARELLEDLKSKNIKLLLPVDHVVADRFSLDANKKTTIDQNIEEGWMGMDIGNKSIELFKKVILESNTIFWNGPMGVFEMKEFAKGTFALAEFIAQASENGAFSAVGGGDSIAAVNKSGYSDKMSYISTGGGATLEYLEGKTLPGIKYIIE